MMAFSGCFSRYRARHTVGIVEFFPYLVFGVYLVSISLVRYWDSVSTSCRMLVRRRKDGRMRESFARRVAGFLVVLLLGVLLTSEHGVFRGAVARALGSGFAASEEVDACAGRRMLTAPVLSMEEAAALARGEFAGPFCLGDAPGE